MLATPVLGIPYLIVLVEVLSLALRSAFRAELSGVDRPARTPAATALVAPAMLREPEG